MDKKVIIVCYPKCSTCKKAENWLKENNIEYDYRDIKGQNPTIEELKIWINQSGLPVRRFFNTSGILYREKNMKDKIMSLPINELIEILASDGMMVKRPILISEDNILVGFREKEWEEILK